MKTYLKISVLRGRSRRPMRPTKLVIDQRRESIGLRFEGPPSRATGISEAVATAVQHARELELIPHSEPELKMQFSYVGSRPAQ